MSKEKLDLTYHRQLSARTTWLYTIIALMLVLLSLAYLSYQKDSGFDLHHLVDLHREFPFLFLFDLFPLFVFLILWLAGRKLEKEFLRIKKISEETARTLEKNSAFATQLSEGDDPVIFDDMLDTKLGQALKLIHLNIKSNRRKEKEITWITEGKDVISRILRLYTDIDELAYQVLKALSKYIDATQGALYLYEEDKKKLRSIALLAYNRRKYTDQTFSIGEGLVGQCAYEMDFIHRTEIPEDYITISSGILGEQKPKSILLIPLITNEKLEGIIEFAFIESRIPKLTIQFMLELGEIIARTFFNLRVNENTRVLLEESQKKTDELRKNEAILQDNATMMKSTQEQLQTANEELQNKINEARMAQDRLHWLLENASEIISIYDKNHRLKYISPSAERILGYTAEDMMKGKDFERIEQRMASEIRSAFDQLTREPGKTKKISYSFLKKDGTRLHLQSTIRNLLDDPSINGFIFNTRDITESLQIEREQRMKSRMQSLSENSLDLIIRMNRGGVIQYANPVVEDYGSIAPSELINKPLNDAPFNKALSEILTDSMHSINAKPIKFNIEETIPVKMGEKTRDQILSINVIPEFQENELETILFVGHDITEAKRIEAEIKTANRKLQDSINYAERIQSSILPSMSALKKAFPRSFIYYKPRDVISGDFPWFYETADAWYIAAIDCTGHGVPGALLSFIAFFLLNNITALNPDATAGKICDLLNQEVRKTLKQDQKNPETRDGMDLALCKIRKNENLIEFVGAHRPMYILRDGELIIFKGDRKSIGGIENQRNSQVDFVNNTFKYRKGDKLFIFSDGLTDQLGGEKGTKYTPARIRESLLNYPGYTIHQFNDFFRSDFKKWMGKHAQIDDVLLIGIEL